MSKEYSGAPQLRTFNLGDRVVVSAKCAGWREDAPGVVCGGSEHVQTVQGADYFYWVQFDTPQHDLSDDGPYGKAQVLGCCVQAETNKPLKKDAR
jgi:hypothetical protein